MQVIERSANKAPSCHYQLTVWASKKSDIQFAIDQLNRHQAPWMLKQQEDQIAVFVPGEKESAPVYPRRLAASS